MSSTTPSAISLLIIDDNPASLRLYSKALAQAGIEILTASSGQDGLALYYHRRPQIVLTELVMSSVGGMQVLEQIMKIDAATDVILATAHCPAESAVEAVKKGASDCLNKPFSLAMLRERVGQLVEQARKRAYSKDRKDDLRTAAAFGGIIGSSPPMCEMLSHIQRVAPYFRTVLVVGETGTGKDMVARALHRLSPRASGPFVVLNCSAVVETLFESELFGHVKGSFTGATHDKPGFFQHAHGGTLFLDEIGDMPLSMQAKLLRVLQDQELQRVGALHGHKVDVHVVAATNHDLRTAMAQKRFRGDLYYRLSMVEIVAPRLVERLDDLPLLYRHFISRFAALYGKDLRGLTNHAQVRLLEHSWPGNVRELENVIGSAAMMTTTDIIDVQDLPPYLQVPVMAMGQPASPIPFVATDALSGHERQLIVHALEKADGNQTRAARILRISRDRLRYKLKKHNLHPSGPREASAAAG